MQRQISTIAFLARSVGALVLAGVVLFGCTADTPLSAESVFDPRAGGFTQVERLARPAINEGLVVSNDFLNAFNAISPDMDLQPVAAPVRAQVVQVLQAVDLLDNTANTSISGIAGAFLPDVMRIDTTVSSPVGTPAYSRAFNALGSPIAGRKLEDDVMDITLSVLVGSTVTDNVPYTRPSSGAGSSNPGIGHRLLFGQSTPNGTATFPFLAQPN
jgi:hypothetical protein